MKVTVQILIRGRAHEESLEIIAGDTVEGLERGTLLRAFASALEKVSKCENDG